MTLPCVLPSLASFDFPPSSVAAAHTSSRHRTAEAAGSGSAKTSATTIQAALIGSSQPSSSSNPRSPSIDSSALLSASSRAAAISISDFGSSSTLLNTTNDHSPHFNPAVIDPRLPCKPSFSAASDLPRTPTLTNTDLDRREISSSSSSAGWYFASGSSPSSFDLGARCSVSSASTDGVPPTPGTPPLGFGSVLRPLSSSAAAKFDASSLRTFSFSNTLLGEPPSLYRSPARLPTATTAVLPPPVDPVRPNHHLSRGLSDSAIPPSTRRMTITSILNDNVSVMSISDCAPSRSPTIPSGDRASFSPSSHSSRPHPYARHNSHSLPPPSPPRAVSSCGVVSSGSPHSGQAASRAPIQRSTRACDSCRARKTRCLESDSNPSGPQGVDHDCARCRELGLNCVWSGSVKKRGPAVGSTRASVDRSAQPNLDRRASLSTSRRPSPPASLQSRSLYLPLSPTVDQVHPHFSSLDAISRGGMPSPITPTRPYFHHSPPSGAGPVALPPVPYAKPDRRRHTLLPSVFAPAPTQAWFSGSTPPEPQQQRRGTTTFSGETADPRAMKVVDSSSPATVLPGLQVAIYGDDAARARPHRKIC